MGKAISSTRIGQFEPLILAHLVGRPAKCPAPDPAEARSLALDQTRGSSRRPCQSGVGLVEMAGDDVTGANFLAYRRLDCTLRHSAWTARVKVAARGRPDWARHVAFEHDPPALHRR